MGKSRNSMLLFMLLLGMCLMSVAGAAEEKTQTVSTDTIRIETRQVVINNSGDNKSKQLEDVNQKEKAGRSKDSKKGFEAINENMRNIWDEVSDWWSRHKMGIAILFGGMLITLGVAALIDMLFVKIFINHFAARSKSELDDMIGVAIRPPLKIFVISIGLLCSAIPLMRNLPDLHFEIFLRVIVALAATSVAVGFYRLIVPLDHVLTKFAERSDNTIDDLVVALLRKAMKITLVVVSILFIGQSILGLNITALVAGAGICGLAIAFASKDAISNILGSVTIILDRPFQVGDRIKVNGIDGSVERVGFRSTRVRTLDGCLVTIPNNSLATSPIENFSARPYIKFFFNLGVTYDTPPEKLERAMVILHEIFDNHQGQVDDLPPRIYFNAFNDFSLNIMIITWYHPGDYFEAHSWLNGRNLEILKRFNGEDIEFAFPTSTTYLAGDSSRPLEVSVKQ